MFFYVNVANMCHTIVCSAPEATGTTDENLSLEEYFVRLWGSIVATRSPDAGQVQGNRIASLPHEQALVLFAFLRRQAAPLLTRLESELKAAEFFEPLTGVFGKVCMHVIDLYVTRIALCGG